MIPYRFVLVLATVTVACAYYNGLYNANRLASEARRAESEGRRGDARSLWLQAAMRADSVAARYPNSKYHDDALLMSGRAQSRVGDCPLAMVPLETVVAVSEDDRIIDQARVLLAECQLKQRRFDDVIETVTPLLPVDALTRHDRARSLRGRAHLALGNTATAARDLSPPTDLMSRFDLAAALLANGEVERARVELAVTEEFSYQETRWMGLLDSLGADDPGSVSGFVDRWVADQDVATDARVRLLMADAQRWNQHGDLESALARLHEASSLSDDSSVVASIRYEIAVVELRRAETVVDITEHIRTFRGLTGAAGFDEIPSDVFVSILERVVTAVNASNSGGLWIFRAAETVRDSLRQHELAALLFIRVATDHPATAIAPKALLALAALRPDAADSIVGILSRDYADSPYTDLATGGVGAGYAALEDSLRQVLQMPRRDSTGGLNRRNEGPT